MDALVVTALHKNQYCNNSGSPDTVRFNSSKSPPTSGFRERNCRTFQYGAGIVVAPLKSLSTSVSKQAFFSSPSSSPKTPTSSFNFPSDDDGKHLNGSVKSSAIVIPSKTKVHSRKEESLSDEFPYSELWAGPAYSNSPPPSSLPIPKFSLEKRSLSLDLPASASDVDLHPTAKSAPSSPTKEHNSMIIDLFSGACVDSATKTLRRILNLDISDE